MAVIEDMGEAFAQKILKRRLTDDEKVAFVGGMSTLTTLFMSRLAAFRLCGMPLADALDETLRSVTNDIVTQTAEWAAKKRGGNTVPPASDKN